MTFLLVTVAWRGRRRDLAVPADVPIADLLRPLAAAMCRGDPSPTGPSPSGPSPTGRRLALAPLGGAPLPAHRTLAACEVGDGAVLVLLE